VDATRERARAAGAIVVDGEPGRGAQQDAGARRSRGEWLLFLHADTRLSPGWAAELRALPAVVVGGAFRFQVDAPRAAFRWLELGVRLRCAIFRLPYGDQALFVRRRSYEACGGFPHLPLMEDVAFVRRLRRVGRLAFLRTAALTSPRRWESFGVWRTSLRNLWFLAQYAAGRSPQQLAARYRRSSSHPRRTS
jgi:uncharacterized protein